VVESKVLYYGDGVTGHVFLQQIGLLHHPQQKVDVFSQWGLLVDGVSKSTRGYLTMIELT
jgi:hypothetical protein